IMARQTTREKRTPESPTTISKEQVGLSTENFLDFVMNDVEKNGLDNVIKEAGFSLNPEEKVVLINYLNPKLKEIYIDCKSDFEGSFNKFKFQPLTAVNEAISGAVEEYKLRFPNRNVNENDLKSLVSKEIASIQEKLRRLPEQLKFRRY